VAAQTGLWLFLGLDVLVLVGIVYAIASDSNRVHGAPRKFSPLSYLFGLAPILLAAVFIYLHPPGSGRPLVAIPTLALTRSPLLPSASVGSAGPADLTWLSVLLAAVVSAGFLTWFFWPARRRRQTPPRVKRETPAPEEPIVQAIDDSIDALRAIADPRQAIIAAYASMESSLGRAGLPRHRSETPIEYVVRAVRSVLEMPADARRLTYLFEFAKFSPHEVDEAMRTDALQALQQIRGRLSVATPT